MSLLAAGVPLCHVKLMLIALQTIGWHLKTGFGLSSESFFGSDDRPMWVWVKEVRCCWHSWLCSHCNPACTVTSLLRTNAYRRLGHCEPAWTGVLLLLAAIIYVDDSDLLIRVSSDPGSHHCWLLWPLVVILKQKKCKE